MSTGFNPQYPQYQQYQPQQGPTASAVNIQIIAPQAYANPAGAGCMCPNYGPQMYPGGCMPGYQPAPPMYPTTSMYDPNGGMGNFPMNYYNPVNNWNNFNNQNTTDPNKQTDKTKTKVILTDDYIRALENYLNNQDAKVRLTAAKQLLERFKEDPSRRMDPALTALLNKVLQDPKASVRYVGLTTLDTGYALGNDETVAILKQIQERSDIMYGEDAVLASNILLKMSAPRVEVPDYSSNKDKKKSE